jgi:hypothetical protein
MAKMFYTMDETKAALGKNEEEIKQFAREGKLREFRDGARLMFKADQVETLKGEMAGGGLEDQVTLPSESGAPIGLVDSRGGTGTGSGSVVALADSDTGAGAPLPKDDTSLAADLGLTGSLGGIPSPGKTGSLAGATGSLAGNTGSLAGKGGTGTGMSMFGTDAEKADPSAQTAISSSIQDQVNLEGVGSGSGLLDLTRESDDTSLGALEMDGTAAGKGKRAVSAPGDTRAASAGAGLSAVGEGGGGRVISQPTYVEANDPMSGAFGGASAGAALVLLFAAFILVCALLGYSPQVVGKVAQYKFPIVAAFGIVPVLIGFIVGMLVGKAR